MSCAHCGIRFLTHPRNARRRDLRCPFGCREHHRRQCSNRRSAAYYGEPKGKRAKKLLNGRRSDPSCHKQQPAEPIEETASPPEPLPEEEAEKIELWLEGVVLEQSSLPKSPMLPYVRMVVRLIEGIALSCQEIVGLLRRSMRQRSIAHLKTNGYVRGFLHAHPP